MPVGSATMGRFEPDDSVTTMASWSTTDAAFPTGGRWPTEGTNVAWMVLQTGRSARLDDFSAATDPIGVTAREAGIKSAVGSPVVVKGRLWGVMTATSTEGPMPPGTEARLASFTELVATAIANAESKSELAASRRRIVAASDETRRRIERNLHDGTQQRLVSLGLAVRAAEAEPSARARRPSRRAVPRRDRSERRGRGSAGDLAWDPPGDPLQGRSRPGVADARSSFRDSCRPRHHDRRATRGADRGGGLLRCVRGSCQRGEAFAGVAHRRLARAARAAACCCPFATTASAERIPPAARDSSASSTASRRSAARSASTVGRARGRRSRLSCRRRSDSPQLGPPCGRIASRRRRGQSPHVRRRSFLMRRR